MFPAYRPPGTCNREGQSKLGAPVIPTRFPTRLRIAVVLATMVLGACSNASSSNAGGGGGRGGRGPGGPITVGYVVVQQGSAPIEQELPGRVAAYQVSELRPPVSGVIQRRFFQEGSIVRQG